MERLIAYFLTWTTYGTWLPGDGRGWVNKHKSGATEAFQCPTSRLEAVARGRMNESAVTLDESGRQLVEHAIRETCNYKRWDLLAVNVRSNHVHAVVAAPGASDAEVLRVIKAYASRALNDRESGRKRWWTEGGSRRYITDKAGLDAAIQYVLEGQEGRW